MPLDPDLLAQARAAEARVIDADRDAGVLRTEFHRAIRRLQLAGGSLREIAQEFGLSHQRVHQIVEATGGSRSWHGSHASAADLVCSFCGALQIQVNQLIAGPGAFICDRCVARARRVLAGAGTTDGPLASSMQQVSATGGNECCRFCGKSYHRVVAMAASGEARICNECLDLCEEIIADNLA